MAVYKYAGFWRRLVAYMIDGFILTVIFFILMIVAGIAFFAGAMTSDSGRLAEIFMDPERMAGMGLWMWLFSILINFGYFIYFHGSTGRTPGKMLLNLQVVSTEGAPIGFGVAFLRSVGYLVSSLVFCLGFIWAGFDKRKQGWHDKIAGTVVIIRAPLAETTGLHISETEPKAESPSASTGSLSGDASCEAPVAPVQTDAPPENQKMP